VRIDHAVLFAEDANHSNGIETFWNQAKRHLEISGNLPFAAAFG
jgi:hypothetical protein